MTEFAQRRLRQWLMLELLEGRRLPSFIAPPYYSTGQTPQAVAVADLTGNGIPDLVTANYDAGTVSVLLGNGDGSFRPHVDYPADGAPISKLVVGDFNGDGIPDLTTLNFNTGVVNILLGHGDGSFGPPTPYDGAKYGGSWMAVGDLKGDDRRHGWPSVHLTPAGRRSPRHRLPPCRWRTTHSARRLSL